MQGASWTAVLSHFITRKAAVGCVLSGGRSTCTYGTGHDFGSVLVYSAFGHMLEARATLDALLVFCCHWSDYCLGFGLLVWGLVVVWFCQ